MTSRPQPLAAYGEPDGKTKAEAQSAAPSGPPLLSIGSPLFKDIRVSLNAGLGQVSMTVEELLALTPGAVIKLDLKLNDLVELRLNQSVVAMGEIVAVDDNFGLRIVEISRAT
jgi:flagellar motor switch protein FliN/FliY